MGGGGGVGGKRFAVAEIVGHLDQLPRVLGQLEKLADVVEARRRLTGAKRRIPTSMHPTALKPPAACKVGVRPKSPDSIPTQPVAAKVGSKSGGMDVPKVTRTARPRRAKR